VDEKKRHKREKGMREISWSGKESRYLGARSSSYKAGRGGEGP